MIFLDLTRIVGRLERCSPTGIDRVEVAYAEFVLAKGGRFVVQARDGIAVLPTPIGQQIVMYISSKWGEGKEKPPLPLHALNWLQALSSANLASELRMLVKRGRLLHCIRRIRKKEWNLLPYRVNQALTRRVVILKLVKRLWMRDKSVEWMDAALGKGNWYLNVGHSGLDKKNLLKLIRTIHGFRVAIYVHDILPISHPTLFPGGERQRHLRRIDETRKYADLIIANSFFTANALSDTENITVNAVLEIGTLTRASHDKCSRRRSGLISIGTLEPRKNYVWLVSQWLKFCDENALIVGNEKLTIYGQVGWMPPEDLNLLMADIAASSHVELVLNASDQDVGNQLQSSRAYVSAAHIEGWGMPLAESLAVGTPVIASDIEAHREVTKGLGVFFKLDDVERFQLLLKMCFDARLLEENVLQTAYFEPWQWSTHFAKLEIVMRENRIHGISNGQR